MSEQKESSVLFSLKELMNLEEDRIEQEENEEKRKADAAERARQEEARRAEDAQQARLQAEEEKRRMAQLIDEMLDRILLEPAERLKGVSDLRRKLLNLENASLTLIQGRMY